MKKVIPIIVFLIFTSIILAQSEEEIVLGKIVTIESKILDEKRPVWIHLPNDITTNKRYPVVYLLDGDAHFYSLVGMIHQLSSINGNTVCPEMIVVGIPNTNRTRDLTPYKPDPIDPFLPQEMISESGGGDKFISFIEKELFPFIDSNYPTAPYKMLIGHSFGGLTVLNTILHHKELFNSYIAIDPSVNWASGRILNEFQEALSNDTFGKASLYLGIANIERGKDLKQIEADTTFVTEHIKAIFELDEYLRKNTLNKLKYKSKFYENDNHGSVPLIAEYDGLHFIFDFYDLNIPFEDFISSDINLIEKFTNHYEIVSKAFGFEVKPDESLINGIGYQFMSIQQMEKARQFFELNVKNFPDSYNVYDSIGDYYSAIDNKQKAIESYKKAQSIMYHDYTEDKLKTLDRE